MSTLDHTKLPVESCQLGQPSLEEVAQALRTGLADNFANVSVDVIECPNLQADEWGLAAPGIGGNTRILDVGGVPYLVPSVDRSRVYDMSLYPGLCDMKEGAFMLGAGAGPFQHINRNCEMMPNLVVGPNAEVKVQNTHISRTYDEDGSYGTEVLPPSETRNALMCNMFLSEGKPGPVIRVSCKKRTGQLNFVTCMRQALEKQYKEPVAMGGPFKLVSGQAKVHVMPEFSECPLDTDDKLNNWLKFYNMDAPFVFLSVFYSSDPGQDVRIEHTHGWGKNGQGGHYHYDTTPDEVEYLGYFNLAQRAVRLDRPKVSHMVGRD